MRQRRSLARVAVLLLLVVTLPSACRRSLHGTSQPAFQQAFTDQLRKVLAEWRTATSMTTGEAPSQALAARLRVAETKADGDALLLAAVARTYYDAGLSGEAERLLRHVLDTTPFKGRGDAGWIPTTELLGRILAARRDPGAEAMLLQSVKALDNVNRHEVQPNEGPYEALGELYLSTGRFHAAARLLRRAADHDPTRAEPNYDAARMSLLAGDVLAAARFVRRGLAVTRTPREAGRLSVLFDVVERIRSRVLAGGSPHVAWPTVVALDLRALAAFDLQGLVTFGRPRPLSSARVLAILEADLLAGDLTIVADVAEFLLRLNSLGLPIAHCDRWRVLSAWVLLIRRDDARAEAAFRELIRADATRADANVGLGVLAVLRRDAATAEALLQPVADAAGGCQDAPSADVTRRMACQGLAWLATGRGEIEAMAAFDRAVASDNERYGYRFGDPSRVPHPLAADAALRDDDAVEHLKFNQLALRFVAQGRTEEARALLRESLLLRSHDNPARALLAGLPPGPPGPEVVGCPSASRSLAPKRP